MRRFVRVGLLATAAMALLFAGREAYSYVQARDGTYETIHPQRPWELPPLLATLRALDDDPVASDADALVQLYSSTCSSCAYNMNNWMTLVADVRRRHAGLVVGAISVEEPLTQRAYWQPAFGR